MWTGSWSLLLRNWHGIKKRNNSFGVIMVSGNVWKTFKKAPWNIFPSRKKKSYSSGKKKARKCKVSDFKISYFITMALNCSVVWMIRMRKRIMTMMTMTMAIMSTMMTMTMAIMVTMMKITMAIMMMTMTIKNCPL